MTTATGRGHRFPRHPSTRSPPRYRYAVVLGVCAVVAACSSKGTELDPADVAACDRFAAAAFAVPGSCAKHMPPETATARARVLASQCAVVLGRHDTGQTAAWVTACAAALEQTTCGAGIPDACALPPSPGTRAVGEPCATDNHCQSGMCLGQFFARHPFVDGDGDGATGGEAIVRGDFSGGGACGTCAASLGEGARCDFGSRSPTEAPGCAPGTRCVPDGYMTGTCQKDETLPNSVPLGAPCNDRLGPHCLRGLCASGFCRLSAGHVDDICIRQPTWHACDDGLSCSGRGASVYAETGQCSRAALSGEACLDLPCADGLRCGGSTGTCTTPVPIRGVCAATVDCGPQAYCQPETTSSPAGTCAPALPLGAGCAGREAFCIEGTECGATSNVCVVRNYGTAWPGEPCNDEEGRQCFYGRCSGTPTAGDRNGPGTCPALAAPGGPCNADSACADAACGTDGTCPDTTLPTCR